MQDDLNAIERYLILGPAYSGKSEYAQSLLTPARKTTVIGTAVLQEKEFTRRVDDLKAQRPAHWQILENAKEILPLLTKLVLSEEQILVDSINQYIAAALVEEMQRYSYEQIEQKILFEMNEIKKLLETPTKQNLRVVLVSSEVGAGVSPAPPVARLFRTICSKANTILARACPQVMLLTAGIATPIRRSAHSI